MANLVKWGTAGSWTNAFESADLNGLANDTSILSTSTAVSNGAGDVYADIDFIGVTGTWTPTSNGSGLDIYILPLLSDGSSYPDGDSASSTAANLAPGALLVGRIVFSGKNITHKGILRGIIIPNGTFKFYMVNRCGVALSAHNHTSKYRLYGENLNG